MEGFWGHLSRLHALGLGLLLCQPVPGPHNVPAPQPQGSARVLGRQAINGAGVAVASRVPGNWRPSNYAKIVSCHPGSHAIGLAQVRPQVQGPDLLLGADPDSTDPYWTGGPSTYGTLHNTARQIITASSSTMCHNSIYVLHTGLPGPQFSFILSLVPATTTIKIVTIRAGCMLRNVHMSCLLLSPRNNSNPLHDIFLSD